MDKRRFLQFATLALAGPAAFAQQNVTKIVVPYPAGGASDILARTLAESLQRSLGQSVVVENRTGASGNIGAALVAKAPPDGRTILLGSQALFAASTSLYKDTLPFDPQKDFAPVILATTFACAVVVPQDSPFRSFKDLLDRIKADDRTTYASAGNATIQHFGGEILKRTAGIKSQHVPYKGGAPAITGVMGGETTFMLALLTEAMPLVRGGRLRALAVTTPSRIPALPDLPAVAEFLPGFELEGWYGFAVPAATPRDVVARLNTAFEAALKEPAVRAKLDEAWYGVVGGPPARLADIVAKDTAVLRRVVTESNMKVD
ncbi:MULTISPECIES: Bug family tripartite tricarboxylate transporter substrate binding protein [Ramlibacter]|uniref:Tripartite tricarboxylate transporter substrate binding protein n=1 Tax=Ramlibacter pinisoli TaxID=2682844 RepID=A0A6N8IVK4_9BURK|nr:MULTISPECIES: tripartite tricarboxylate transporter substrate binding protein [Ramlibacter]MBA2965018.1 tripartite tricarboxylate transporter substrate binding protein [Ramlibacter sp. CGMCC 1.13660]MVQ29983.1 tripartite tricarboxylate transporter substrate binding protein [Ramlibacter pinisoli]